jgi:glycosyltransferase involved in cell wall biosynthesis
MGQSPGGSGWWLSELADCLGTDGRIKLTVVNCGPQYGRAEQFQAGGITYWGIPATTGELLGRGCDARLKQLAHVVGESGAELVDVHGTECFYGLISPLLRVPVVVTLQGVMAEIWKKYFADLGAGPALWQTRRGPLDIRSRVGVMLVCRGVRQRVRTEAEVLRRNRYYIGRTDWDHACQKRLCPQGRYFHCHRILRPAFRQPMWLASDCRSGQVFCTSAAEVYKGAHTLVDAAARLAVNVPHLSVRIAGGFDGTAWGATLRRRVNRVGLSGRVEFVGYLNQQQVLQELRHANVFVIPSFIETECIALCEAMSVGVPCVASTAGGMGSTLTDGHDGLAFRPGNTQQLAEQLGHLLINPGLAERLGQNASRTAQKRHDPGRIADTMVHIYQTVVAVGRS